MKRRKKQEEHVDESWLIPYADILTLLLALFIVLFAASEIDAQKFKQISESFNSELQGGTGSTDEEPVENPVEPSAEEESDSAEELEDITPEQDFKELGELQEKIEGYVDEKGLSTRLDTVLTTKGLLLKIREGVLYQSGSADINANSRTIAKEISDLLVTDHPRNIYIEGHTDNVPTDRAEFPSNWELSSSRAINFMKILLENDKLNPKKFSATGYGEHHPIASNDSSSGRAENRRVEVLISPYAQPE